ncbi:MAG: outer membrane lipid asymmetry maintenance protein MlaD [Betaproteobacteria bacterium]|nr:outer membrane lipid asymmetry maintenance protein MlaD [Betaproteobacteria bacterium]
MNRSAIDLWVGVFVTMGIAAVFFMALKVGNLSSFNSAPGYLLEARFHNIGGLKARAPIKSSGVRVGRVESIALDTESYEAVVTLRIEEKFSFTRDTIASILTSGLLGEQYIGLDAGGDPTMLKTGERIAKTQDAFVMEKLIGQFMFNKAAEGGGGK